MTLAAFIALLLYWSVAALAAVMYLRRGVEADPGHTLRVAAMRLVVPAALFAALTTALLLPNLTEVLLGSDPHHGAGADLRLHGLAGSAAHWTTLILLAGLVLWAWLPPLLSWARYSWLVRHLVRVGERRRTHELVASHRRGHIRDREVIVVPGAWIGLVGVLRPTLVVGEDLLTGLREPELVAALAHEAAHERHSHSWKRLLLLIVSRMLPVLGKRLLGRWTDAAENLCDQSAARVVQNPAWVASALLGTHRLQRTAQRMVPQLEEGAVALGFASPDALAHRIQRLLELPEHENRHIATRGGHAWLLLLAVSTIMILMHAPLHHAVERLLASIH
jgi:Zn-dependent protease with chaperone function